MRNRRPTQRNRGRITLVSPGAPAPAPIVFWTQFTGATVLAAYQSDFGVTQAGTVSQWDDLSGNGFHLTAVGAAQPTYNASDLNGFPTISFDGTDDVLANVALDLPAPGTTPLFLWMVIQQTTWVNGDGICGFGSGQCIVRQLTSTPNVHQNNGINGPLCSGAALSSWVRGEVLFNNSTTDYVKLGSVTATGTNAGNTNPTAGFRIGSTTGAAAFGNFKIAAMALLNAVPSNLAAMSALVTSKYGGTVGV